MKNILITGGCGFIGSNFLNYMLEKYPKLNFINIDALYYCADIANITSANRKRDNYKFIKGNITNGELLNFILCENKIDTVIHFAAQSHVDNSFSNPLQYTKDNIVGTHTLLECCRKWGKIQRFIHVSTDEVYGESLSGGVDGDIKNEKSILNPTNPYAATKASAEMIVNSYVYSYNMPIIITRGNNVYGPRQYPEKVIPKFIKLLLSGKKCTVHGQGKTERSFLYVDDVSRAFETILFSGKIGEIYNIGTNDEHSVLTIAKMLVKKILGNKTDYKKWIEFIADRNYNDKRYNISFSKLTQLGWKQQIDLATGLDKTIKWYTKLYNT